MVQAVKIFNNPFAFILLRKHWSHRNFSEATGNIENKCRLAEA